MKKHNIFYTVFAGALSSLVAANNSANAEENEFHAYSDLLKNNSTEFRSTRKIDNSLKLLLKMNASGDWYSEAHRSHQSHQSHRSHYSSQGGHYSHFSHYSGSSGTTGSSGTNNGGTNNNGGSGSGNYTKPTTYSSTYQLGSRTIYPGMKGTDVTQVVNILIKKNYLTVSDGSSTVTGEYKYEGSIVDAIKRFQKDNNLKEDGIIGSTTTFYLKK